MNENFTIDNEIDALLEEIASNYLLEGVNNVKPKILNRKGYNNLNKIKDIYLH